MAKFPGCHVPATDQEQYRHVLTLAQCLLAEPEFYGADAGELDGEVAVWFRAMDWQPHRTLGSVLDDFRAAWATVECPMGRRPIDRLWAEAGRMEPPLVCQYRNLDQSQLACLCWRLQLEVGEGEVFRIGCRTAAQVSGRPFRTTARWLRRFREDGWLRLVKAGDVRTRTANEYRVY